MFDEALLAYVSRAVTDGLLLDGRPFILASKAVDWPMLELNQRVSRLAEILNEVLGAPFEVVQPRFMVLCDWLRSEGQYHQGYQLMFLPAYLQRYGLADPFLALDTIERLTQVVSCEFAIRPLLRDHQQMVMDRMMQLAKHPVASVRRLASEGCRPRLPWGLAMQSLIKEPTPIMPILTTLKADPSLYVRKSVANNLNDISKTHPELVLAWAENNVGQHPDTDRIINHGMRTLLKAGNPKALSLMGWHAGEALGATIQQQNQAHLGQEMTFRIEVHLPTAMPRLRLEYVIAYHRPSKPYEKVFMLTKTALEAGTHHYDVRLSLADLSTRKHHAGPHKIAVKANGIILAELAFDVLA